jgi:hypothetical protein
MLSNIFRLFIFIIIGVGCTALTPQYPHVTLQLPSKDAPVEERVEAYKQLQTDKNKFTTVTTTVRDMKPILLANGTEVFWIEDLLPLVPSDSITAKKINDALASYKKARKKSRQGYVIFLAGSIPFLLSINISNRALAITVGVTGAAISSYGMLRVFSGQFDLLSYLAKPKEIVYAFNTDILLQLNLCFYNQEYRDCSEVSQ